MRLPTSPHSSDPLLPLASHEQLGESPLWPSLAVVVAAGLYGTLPTGFLAGHATSGAFGVARYAIPILVLILLGPLALSVPRGVAGKPFVEFGSTFGVTRRVASIAVIALLSIANGVAIVLLVRALVTGQHAQARELLRVAIHLWSMNVIAFALWYWQLDGGGPLRRRTTPPGPADFVFPQQMMEQFSATWRPVFVDYLFVSFTNATAFSPTDTPPLSRWAKILMMAQSAASLLLAVMVAARAVNILQ